MLLGVGRGFERGLFRAFGVDPRTKRDRFDAALDAILAAWRGTDPDAAPDLPLPAQRPHPPIVVAAFGPKGLAQAARRGLPYLASPMEDLATLADNYARHRSGLPDDVETDTLEVPVMRTVHVAADAAEARRVREAIETEFSRIAALRGRALARVAEGKASDRILVGEAAEVAEGIARYREALGMDLLVVRPAPGAHGDERRASLERLAEAVSGVA